MGAAGPAARREEGEYSTYLTDEQRSRRAGSARFGDGRLSPRAARARAAIVIDIAAHPTTRDSFSKRDRFYWTRRRRARQRSRRGRPCERLEPHGALA